MSDCSELKPCPFCGGQAESELYWSCDCCAQFNAFVICKTCAAEVSHFNTNADAVTAWNTRTDATLDPMSDSRVVALVEASQKAANRLEWMAGLVHSDKARDQGGDWAEELRSILAAMETKK